MMFSKAGISFSICWSSGGTVLNFTDTLSTPYPPPGIRPYWWYINHSLSSIFPGEGGNSLGWGALALGALEVELVEAQSMKDVNLGDATFSTLSPTIMEVENHPKWKETNIGGTPSPHPWLWEEGVGGGNSIVVCSGKLT